MPVSSLIPEIRTPAPARPLLLDMSRSVWRAWRGQLPTGIDRVCLAYAAHYRSRARAVIQHDRFRGILSERASRALFDLLLDGGDFRSGLSRLALRSPAAWLNRQRGDGLFYLNVGHTGLDQPGLRDWIGRARVRPIYMVHDLIPLTHPEHCRAGEDDRHALRMRTVLETGHGIIANSRATLDTLADWATRRDIPLPPARVAWLGTTPLPAPCGDAPLPGPYFVTLGTVEARKNHRMLLQLWRTLVERLGPAAPKLVVIGQRGWMAHEAHAMLDDPALRNHVIELPACDDTTLARYLAHAFALLFPAFAEGYGLPLIEALAAGTPIIASDLPVFRELAGDLPCYRAPDDAAGWGAAIEDFARDGPERRGQLARITHYRAPTWRDHFAAVDGWLEALG